jgi:hypothetical protein
MLPSVVRTNGNEDIIKKNNEAIKKDLYLILVSVIGTSFFEKEAS